MARTKKANEAPEAEEVSVEQAFANLRRDIVREDRGSLDRLRERQANTRLTRAKYDALVAGAPATVIDVAEHEGAAARAEYDRVIKLIRATFADAIEYFAEHGYGLEEDDLAGRRAAMGASLDVLLAKVAAGDEAAGG